MIIALSGLGMTRSVSCGCCWVTSTNPAIRAARPLERRFVYPADPPPAPADGMSGAVCQPMPGRLATYRVVVADDLTLGFIRLDVSDQKWIARTIGSERAAAFCGGSMTAPLR